jgi:hypothetical protein
MQIDGNEFNRVELNQMFELLRDNGHSMTRINDWLWLLDDEFVIIAYLVESSNKLQKGLVLTAA